MATMSVPSAILILSSALLTGAATAQERPGEAAAIEAGAHWLITSDGERIETRGPWAVEGRRVLYTDTRGVLASLRLSAVDLEASESASRPPVTTVVEPGEDPSSRAPALVLSNRDVAAWNGVLPATTPTSGNGEEGAVSSPMPAAAAANSPAATTSASGGRSAGGAPSSVSSGTATAVPASARLSVVSYRDLGDYDQGIQLFGTVRNDSATTARNVRVNVRVLDETGTELEAKAAQIRNRQLAAGATLTFRVGFPDLRAYGSVEFDLSSDG